GAGQALPRLLRANRRREGPASDVRTDYEGGHVVQEGQADHREEQRASLVRLRQADQAVAREERNGEHPERDGAEGRDGLAPETAVAAAPGAERGAERSPLGRAERGLGHGLGLRHTNRATGGAGGRSSRGWTRGRETGPGYRLVLGSFRRVHR